MTNKIFINQEGELRSFWWIVIYLLILSILLVLVIVLADRYSFEISMSHQLLIIFTSSVICQALRRKSVGDLLGSMNINRLKELLYGIMLGAVLMCLPVLLLTITGYVHWQINAISFSTFRTGFSVLLISAMAEELLFRGFLFQRLIQSFGNWPAQIIIAGMFLLTHINNPNLTGILSSIAYINIFIASIMFGVTYIKTRSLAMPVGFHFMANLVQGPVFGFGVSGNTNTGIFLPSFNQAPLWLSGGDFGMEASVLGLCSVIGVTVYLYTRSFKSSALRMKQ